MPSALQVSLTDCGGSSMPASVVRLSRRCLASTSNCRQGPLRAYLWVLEVPLQLFLAAQAHSPSELALPGSTGRSGWTAYKSICRTLALRPELRSLTCAQGLTDAAAGMCQASSGLPPCCLFVLQAAAVPASQLLMPKVGGCKFL